MISGKATITNKNGLHIKPAGSLSSIALTYPCAVYLKVRNYYVNAKSVLGILSAQVKEFEEVEIVCDGEKENECLDTIKTAIENKFSME